MYEFEIGPFKKPTSKFSEGMLPWLCDVDNVRKENDTKLPAQINLASKYISDVTYTSKKLDEGSMSFLKFKLFI